MDSGIYQPAIAGFFQEDLIMAQDFSNFTAQSMKSFKYLMDRIEKEEMYASEIDEDSIRELLEEVIYWRERYVAEQVSKERAKS